ncbi:MAG: DUF2029 domain-containing protein [Myxococcales bacterium]|nr:DUF2029 domain-containing protein [Myxococcales bacterium]MCB9608997.1 DUF2029 domain-containing protein [Polyangiaceae bacterium]
MRLVETLNRFAGVDFYDYYFAGTLWRQGHNPYDAVFADTLARNAGLPCIPGSDFIYPPWVAAFIAPLTLLSPGTAFLVWSLLSLMAIGGTVRILRAAHVPPVAAFAILGPPTLFSLLVGQCNLFVLLLVSLAWVRRTRHPSVAAGLIAAAGAIKIAPLILLAAAPRGHRLAWLVGATTVLAVAAIVGELAIPGGLTLWWTDALAPATRMAARLAHPVNQGLDGVLSRTLLTNPWTVPVAAIDPTQLGLFAHIVRGLVILVAAGWAQWNLRSAPACTWRVWGALATVSVLVSPLAWEPAFTMLAFPFVLHARHSGVDGARWIIASMTLILAQRALDPLVNSVYAGPLIRLRSQLSSLGFLGGICLLVALRPCQQGDTRC